MDFIAGLMLEPNGAAKARWSEISAAGKIALSETSAHGGTSFEVTLLGEDDVSTAEETYIRSSSLLSGIIFSSDTYAKASSSRLLDDEIVRGVRESRGAYLCDRFWGHYVGLFFDPESGDLLAMRDPAGGKYFYYAHLEGLGLILFSNSLSALGKALGGRLEFDRKMMALYLAYLNGLPNRRTGFAAITALLPGECLHIEARTGELTSDLPWWRKVASTPEAREGPGEALAAVVDAWSSVSGKIALQLSGGLDSSGLLGMLGKLGHSSQVHCLSHFWPNGVTDERHHARLAAQHVKAALTEIDMDGLRFSLELAQGYRYSARPHVRQLYSELNQLFDSEARAAGCETYWLGFGGDTLFMTLPSPNLMVDALRRDGLKEAYRTAVEIALFEEKSLWRVLFEAISTRSGPSSVLDWGNCQSSGWIPQTEDLEDADKGSFALIDSCFQKIPVPAQRRRLYDIYFELCSTSEERQIYTAGGLNYVLPYHSQPFVSSVLSIPSYRTIQFGMNRFPQRELIAGMLPPELSNRITKGGVDDQVHRSLLADADEIEEFLANGLLQSTGLIKADACRIDRTRIQFGEAHKNFPIVNLLACEIWLAGHREILQL